MESLFVVTAVIAVTELLKRIEAKDTRGALTIVCASVIGVVAGYFRVEGLTVFTGLIAGLGAAGIMRVGQAVGAGK